MTDLDESQRFLLKSFAERSCHKLRAAGFSTWTVLLEHNVASLTLSDDLTTKLGYGHGEVPAHWSSFVECLVHPDDQAELIRQFNTAAQHMEASINTQCRIRCKKRNIWHWFTFFGALDAISDDGNMSCLSGGIKDLNTLKPVPASIAPLHMLNADLISEMPGLFLCADSNGFIIRLSRDLAEKLPLPTKPLSSRNWLELFTAESARIARIVTESATNNDIFSFQAELKDKNGRGKAYLCQGRLIYSESKRKLAFLFFDMGELKAGNLDSQLALLNLEEALKTAGVGVWDWNVNNGYRRYSETWAKVAGVNLSDIQGDSNAWEHLVLADDLPHVLQMLERHKSGQIPIYRADYRMRKPDGSVFWCSDKARVIERNTNGTAARLVGVFQDITPRKEAEIQLKRNAHHLHLVVSEARLGTWEWNVARNELFYNTTFISQLQYNQYEVEDTPEFWLELVHPDDQLQLQAGFAAMLNGQTDDYEGELRVRHRDGHYIWFYDVGHVIDRDTDGNALRIVGGRFDIDKHKRNEKEQKDMLDTIARQKKELEQTVEERTKLLRQARLRVDEILAATGQAATSPEIITAAVDGQSSEQSRSPANYALMAQEPAAQTVQVDSTRLADKAEDYSGGFARYLERAFDLITEKMWWYKAILDSIPFPIFVTDMENRWTYLNKPAIQTLGEKSLPNIVGRKSHPWGIDRNPHTLAGEKLKPDEGSGIFSRYHPELNRYFQGQLSFLYDQKGLRIGHIEAMQDVTSVHEADERTRIMLDATPLACNFWDNTFKNIDCNLAAAKLFHLSDKQEYLNRFFELSPEYQPCGRLSQDMAVENITIAFTQGYCRFEWLHQYIDGTPVPTEITLVRVEYGKGHIVVGYTRDLRELRLKEAELDKERRLLLKIMDNSPVCFVIIVSGVVRFATPYAIQFFGITIGEPVGFFADSQELQVFFNELKSKGAINWRVISGKAADGNIREMLANAFEAEYYGEPCVMSWFMDITEMRETEKQLRLARDAAEESTKAKGDFLANMSHEIRTPMNAILGMTRLVLDTHLSDRQRGYLEKAEQSARALLRILNDILDFSKIEAGKLEMETVVFQLRDVMNGVVDMFTENAGNRGLFLHLSIGQDVPPNLLGDPLRLHQILINLVGNAIKFTERGGVTLNVAVSERHSDTVVLLFSVRDTGIGLAPAQKEKLFSAFAQADTSTTRRYGGTGLGLAISKSLVEMMHGNINCNSEQGKGAEFTFSATFESVPGEELAADNSAGPSSTECVRQPKPNKIVDYTHLKGKKILVAEDNEINQIVAREILEKFGFEVEMADNGHQALEMALSKVYDLIFMDIQMPEMDGLTAAAKIRQHQELKEVPIVAMTAHAMVGDREKSLSAGMNDHITKPIDSNEVLKVIARCLSLTNKEHCSSLPGDSERKIAAEPLDFIRSKTGLSLKQAVTLPQTKPPLLPDNTEKSSAATLETAQNAIKQEKIVTELPSSLPGIDVASGITRVANNKKLYLKLLRQVAGEAPATQEKLTTAIMNGDAATVREIAHSLKGSSSNLSMINVAKAAEQLETAAKAEDFSNLFVHLDMLEQALKEFTEVVAGLEGL